ncbi:MAG: hypothetical protein OEV50_07290, partial [Candidatus Aminicenantes bacterium]|nr:hypothetical protein [Candidatus Aminicenantes bacterium]
IGSSTSSCRPIFLNKFSTSFVINFILTPFQNTEWGILCIQLAWIINPFKFKTASLRILVQVIKINFKRPHMITSF